jgi:hypothetical protein
MTAAFFLSAAYFASYSAALFFVKLPIWVGLSAMFVSVTVAVMYTVGSVEQACVVSRHAALFFQALFLIVFVCIGSEDEQRFLAVLIGTVSCFIVSAGLEIFVRMNE